MDAIETYQAKSGDSMKSWWSRPEGKMGMVWLAGMAAAVGYGLFKVLPYVITILENTIYATFLAVVLFVIFFILTNPRVRTLGKYLFMATMRAITGLFVELNPIAILEGRISEMKERIEDINDQRKHMNQKIALLEAKRNRVVDAISDAEVKIRAADNRGNESAKVNAAQVHGLSTKRREKLEKAITTLGAILNALTVIGERAEQKVVSAQLQVDAAKDDLETSKIVNSAINSARNILKGGHGQDLYNLALEHVDRELADALGGMRDFMDDTRTLFEDLDLEDEMAVERALETVGLVKNKGEKLLASPSIAGQLPRPTASSAFSALAEEVSARR